MPRTIAMRMLAAGGNFLFMGCLSVVEPLPRRRPSRYCWTIHSPDACLQKVNGPDAVRPLALLLTVSVRQGTSLRLKDRVGVISPWALDSGFDQLRGIPSMPLSSVPPRAALKIARS